MSLTLKSTDKAVAFSDDAYSKWDHVGKRAAIKYFSPGFYLVDGKESRGVDLTFKSKKHGGIIYVEAEVRVGWDFPYSEWERRKPHWKTTNIPCRKADKVKIYGNKFFYFQVNRIETDAFVFSSEHITDDKRFLSFNNVRDPEGEWFFKMPIDLATIVQL